MEKKYYIIPTIKVKEIEVESLMAGESIPVDETGGEDNTITDPNEIEAKPMYGNFNVWDK
ncbi:MAG: hypothetical protein IKQ03_06290 [Prevotella sp.]|jgi:hypothetical protein|nr:hypothetical protein [Prevotella sp.]MBR4699834.1 hypothetical protein [Prevotella sp.]